MSRTTIVPSADLLYDADCGFCRWVTARLLTWDRRRALRPVAIQEPRGAELLAGLPHERRLASWHLVTDGVVRSGGEAIPPLFRLLPGGRPVAGAAAAVQPLTNRLYDAVAQRRVALGRLVGRGARERADRVLRERTRSPA